ncbi:serine hydrolase [Paenibacillus sp. AR247]|uniref:serine hydrolase n=1 Tax=Paenibacillus sp. AR247 TaxID=1631599 RepID=UPI000CF86FFA|nr:serine hydrolase [Paenibacillus sp. AR247]PQP90602.1 hypothetical protein CPT76_06545 [Paenibacillus sp. AR247]
MTRRRKPVLRRTLMTTIAATALLTSLLPAASDASPDKGLSAIASALTPILQQAEKDGIRMSVGIRDLSGHYGHETLLLGSREPYMPASTIKLAVVSALMQQVDRGELSLADQVTVTPEDVVGGSGSLQTESFPQNLTLERLARLMITQSDNTATNVLIDKVGMDRVQQLMDQLDLRTMHLGRKMFAAAPSPPPAVRSPAPSSLPWSPGNLAWHPLRVNPASFTISVTTVRMQAISPQPVKLASCAEPARAGLTEQL